MELDVVIDFYNQFARIHNQFSVVKRNSTIDDGENIINPSEMQILSIIYSNPSYTSVDIANQLYITKSATSQQIKKLSNKGYINKVRDTNNERKVILQLTDRGNKAVERFLGDQSEILHSLLDKMENLSDVEVNAIKYFFNELEGMLDNKLK